MVPKSKMCVSQNWPNLEKRPPFLHFLSKLSDFFFGERSKKSSFFYQKPKVFEGILFLLGCNVWKMDEWPLSAPPRAYFCYPKFLKKNFGNSWHQTAFTKKKFGKFWWKLKEYTPYPKPVGTFSPPPHPLGLRLALKQSSAEIGIFQSALLLLRLNSTRTFR